MPARRLDQILWQFFGDAEKPLAAAHFIPDLVRGNPGMDPENDQIIEQIRALADHGLGLTVKGVNHDLYGFLGQFLGHFGPAGFKQPGGARFRRIGGPGGQNGAVQA